MKKKKPARQQVVKIAEKVPSGMIKLSDGRLAYDLAKSLMPGESFPSLFTVVQIEGESKLNLVLKCGNRIVTDAGEFENICKLHDQGYLIENGASKRIVFFYSYGTASDTSTTFDYLRAVKKNGSCIVVKNGEIKTIKFNDQKLRLEIA